MSQIQQRAAILFDLGATVSVANELLGYTPLLPEAGETFRLTQIPLPSEPHVSEWQSIAEEAESESVLAALGRRFFQLHFPIRTGISETAAYQALLSRGDFSQLPAPEEWVCLDHPKKLLLLLHESIGGTVPVLVTNGRSDFVRLIQTLGYKNEPVPVPEVMGAAIISGLVNWGRLHRLKEQWLEDRESGPLVEVLWQQEFNRYILPHRELYRDTIILLSDSDYSGITSGTVGLPADAWQETSHTIRLEHEATHYLMRRLGIARPNHLLDELIADFRGIVAATGRFRADWFLHFMGLESYPHWRNTGRLLIYRGAPPLSDDAFVLLQRLVYDAAHQLAAFYNKQLQRFSEIAQQLRLVVALANLSLEELAAPDAQARMAQAITRIGEISYGNTNLSQIGHGQAQLPG